MDPFNFVYYQRHAKSSMRFYSAQADVPGLPFMLSEAKTPMEVSLAHDFTQRRDTKLSVPEYQLVNLVSKCFVSDMPFRTLAHSGTQQSHWKKLWKVVELNL